MVRCEVEFRRLRDLREEIGVDSIHSAVTVAERRPSWKTWFR